MFTDTIVSDGSLAQTAVRGRRGMHVVLPRASEVLEAAAQMGGVVGGLWAAAATAKADNFGASERMSAADVEIVQEALAIWAAPSDAPFVAPRGAFGELTKGAELLARMGLARCVPLGREAISFDLARGTARANTVEALQVRGDWHHGSPIHSDREIGGYWRNTKTAEHFIRSANNAYLH
jgi:hypothetical protein